MLTRRPKIPGGKDVSAFDERFSSRSPHMPEKSSGRRKLMPRPFKSKLVMPATFATSAQSRPARMASRTASERSHTPSLMVTVVLWRRPKPYSALGAGAERVIWNSSRVGSMAPSSLICTTITPLLAPPESTR